jgi:hypothetical protein
VPTTYDLADRVVLVNNAGIAGLGDPKPLLETPLEE